MYGLENGDSEGGTGHPLQDGVFKAIADPTRRLILDELLEHDGQTLFELVTRILMRHRVKITRQGISKHLALLEAAGLLRIERQGRYTLHHLEPGPLRAVTKDWLGKFTNEGRTT